MATEAEKFIAAKPKAEVLSEFLDWLDGEGIALAENESASKKVRDALMSHGWWSGDKLSTSKLERILAVLEEPDEPVSG